MSHPTLPRLAKLYPQATHVVRINGDSIPVRASTTDYKFLSGVEDCPGCGQQRFGLINSPTHALLCDVCGMYFPLIPIDSET